MSPDLNILAAEGYFELEMFEDALEELETAAALPANRNTVDAMRLGIFIAQKRWKEARPLAERLCEDQPENPLYFIQCAYVYRELNRFEDARCVLLDGPEELEQTGIFYYNLACYEALLGEGEVALSTLQHAFRIDSSLLKTAHADPDLASIREQLPDPE